MQVKMLSKQWDIGTRHPRNVSTGKKPVHGSCLGPSGRQGTREQTRSLAPSLEDPRNVESDRGQVRGRRKELR